MFILFTVLFTALNAEENDTNIVCYAAKKQWICAPEGKEELANKKATKLLKDNKTELKSSEVVINTINIPKFDSVNTNTEPKGTSQQDFLPERSNNQPQKDKGTRQLTSLNSQGRSANPYAELWSHQLIGLSSSDSAIAYVKKMNLNPEEILIIKSARKGADWWIVLYGLYKDKQTGLENQSTMPSAIKKPWLRPLKNLKVFGFIDKF